MVPLFFAIFVHIFSQAIFAKIIFAKMIFAKIFVKTQKQLGFNPN
jgi:hypothetical protein